MEDDSLIRGLIHRLAGEMGYEAVEAESAEKGLELMGQKAVSLVITDLSLPELDGLSMAKQMIAQDPDLPIILITGYPDLDNAREAIHTGIYEYFTKPLEIPDLMASIKRGLEHRRLVLENRSYQQGLEQKVQERTSDLGWANQLLQEREKLLEESEVRTRAVVETAVDGIITINEQGVVGSFNSAATKILWASRSFSFSWRSICFLGFLAITRNVLF